MGLPELTLFLHKILGANKLVYKDIYSSQVEKRSRRTLNNFFGIDGYIKFKLTVTNFEQYWKLDDSFQIKINCTEPTDRQLSKFLEGIATK